MAKSIYTCSLLLVAIINAAVCEVSVGAVVTNGAEEQEFVPPRAISDLEQNRSRDLIPILKAAKLSFGMHDDDHSNIELDKLNDMNRYEILPTSSVVSPDVHSPEVDALILARLVEKMVALNRASKFGKNSFAHQDHKRNIRRLAALREDKDYSFVANPYMSKQFVSQQRSAAGNRWAQKLRDLILSRGPSSSYTAEDTNRDLDRPLQVDLQSADSFANSNSNGNNIYLDESGEPLPKQREKRRRCKIDPNLGVKNPSFCDTDAYFGAADYSMRDVWDSAGR